MPRRSPIYDTYRKMPRRSPRIALKKKRAMQTGTVLPDVKKEIRRRTIQTKGEQTKALIKALESIRDSTIPRKNIQNDALLEKSIEALANCFEKNHQIIQEGQKTFVHKLIFNYLDQNSNGYDVSDTVSIMQRDIQSIIPLSASVANMQLEFYQQSDVLAAIAEFGVDEDGVKNLRDEQNTEAGLKNTLRSRSITSQKLIDMKDMRDDPESAEYVKDNFKMHLGIQNTKDLVSIANCFITHVQAVSEIKTKRQDLEKLYNKTQKKVQERGLVV